MHFLIKLAISICIISLCVLIGKKFPSLAGLIATMPLTGAIVLIWLSTDNPGNHELMMKYTKGALWGILPSILFFLVALLCFKKHLSLPVILSASFGVWLIGAALHQWFLNELGHLRFALFPLPTPPKSGFFAKKETFFRKNRFFFAPKTTPLCFCPKLYNFVQFWALFGHVLILL